MRDRKRVVDETRIKTERIIEPLVDEAATVSVL